MAIYYMNVQRKLMVEYFCLKKNLERIESSYYFKAKTKTKINLKCMVNK